MRRFAARFRFVWLAAGLALLLAPVAQARRSVAGDIAGTWTNSGGGITITVTASGSGFVGELTTATKGCTAVESLGIPAWNITMPSPAGGTYAGTAMNDIGMDSSGNCWAEGSQSASWNVNIAGTQLVMKFWNSGTNSTWTKAGSTTGTNAKALARDNAVRTGVNKTFNAIYKANKTLSKCEWGHCRKAAVGLQRVAHHWFDWCGTGKHGQTSFPVTAGLRATKASLNYWTQTAVAAIKTDTAIKTGNTASAKHWYRVYLAKFKQAVKYKNRARKLLWPG